MYNKIICKCCNEDTSEYINYTLTSGAGEEITVCDSCYQELSMLERINNTWVEYIIIDGIEYLK